MSQQHDIKINFPTQDAEANAKRLEDAVHKVGDAFDQTGEKASQVAQVIRTKEENAAEAAQRRLALVQQSAQREMEAEQRKEEAKTRAAQKEADKRVKIAQKEAEERAKATRESMNKWLSQGGGGGGDDEGGGGSGGGHGLGGGYGATHPRLALANMIGIGAGGYLGFEVFSRIARDIKELITQTAEGARQLQNFANVMGFSIQQAQTFQAAAKLSGVEIGSLENSIRTLSQAMEDPAGAGKRAADALRELHVETVNLKGELRDPGQVAAEFVQKLTGLQDVAKQDALAFAALGRSAKELEPLIKNSGIFDKAAGFGDSFKETQSDLLRVNEALETMKLRSEELARQLVAGLAPAIDFLHDHLGNLFSFNPANGAPNRGTGKGEDPSRQGVFDQNWHYGGGSLGIHMGGSDVLSMRNRLENNNLDLLRAQSRSAQKSSSEDISRIDEILKSGKMPDKSLIDRQKAEEAEAKRLQDRIKLLEEQDRKTLHIAETFPEVLAKLRDRVKELVDGNKGPVAKLDEQYNDILRQYQIKPLTKNWSDLTAAFGQLRDEALRQQGNKDEYKAENLTAARQKIANTISGDNLRVMGEQANAAWHETDPAMAWLLKPEFAGGMPPMSAEQVSQLQRMAAQGRNKLSATLSGPGNEGLEATDALNARIAEINENLRKQLEEDQSHLKDVDLINQQEKDLFASRKEGVQVALQYEQELATIRKQQLNETREWASGLFNAAISGKPGATSNFFRNWGMGMADKIVGNFAANTLGTFNSHLTLQRDLSRAGVLGSPDANAPGGFKTNALGNLLAGTPWGIDASKGGGKNTLQDATQKNTEETKSNNERLNRNNDLLSTFIGVLGRATGVDVSAQPGMGSAAGQSASAPSISVAEHSTIAPLFNSIIRPISSSISAVGSAISSGGSPTSMINAVSRVIGGFGGTSGFAGRVGAADSRSGGGTTPNTPSVISATPISPLMTNIPNMPPVPVTLTGLDTLSSGKAANLGIKDSLLGSTDNTVGILGKLSSGIGGLMGGAKYGTNGTGLSAVFDGVGSNSDGSDATSLDTSERIGAGLAMAGQVTGGVMTAMKGFGQGGARGDIQGIAGSAMALAPFTGPAAPFIEAGGSLLGMISGLFPDPRQERMKQEQGNLTSDAFIAPAQHAYNFTAGSGTGGSGFSLGSGSSLNAGGPSANYTVQIHALDAGSFVDWANKNPQSLNQVVMAGLSQGASGAIDSEIAFRAQYGGAIPNGW